MTPLRLVFMGTPELARVCLDALLKESAFEVKAVVTQPDRPKGRDLKLQPSPVKELATSRGIPVLQPERARDEGFLKQLAEFQPDLIAVAAFGQILPKTILDLPRYGCLNVHTSLLPKYRGAAPIQWAILNDESETGVTIMKMDIGMDTGDILTQQSTPINATDNAQTLLDRLADMGAELLVRTIPDYVASKIPPRPQPANGVSLAPKIKKQDGNINWAQPARTIWNRIRGLVPWPGAFTTMPAQPQTQPQLLKVWQAQVIQGSVETSPAGAILEADKHGILVGCLPGSLRLLTVQREGGKRLSAAEFLAGHGLRPGQRLGA
jgi:methionyl-tRNA formyltransferase